MRKDRLKDLLLNIPKVYIEHNLVGYIPKINDPEAVKLKDLLNEDTKSSLNSTFYKELKNVKIVLFIDKDTFNSGVKKYSIRIEDIGFSIETEDK